MAAKEKKGLGTGLGVLFGEDNYTDENELKLLPVSRLEPRREQPRTVFDDASLQELAESLRRYGVIQPVTARRLENGFYQIIAGERRWRVARLAGLEEIPVRVIEADDRRTAELALVENLQREDLNPIEEARGYQALIDEYGMTQEEAAQSVGRSRPAITNAIRLLSLSPAVLRLVEEGKLSAGHARALLPIAEEKAQKAAADEVLKKSLSVRGTEQLAAPVISTGSRGVYVSHGANRHQIQWSAVANASSYELAYSADGVRWTTVSASGTGAVVTGLTYGADVTYRVRALGTGSYTDSDWSRTKTFNVCPMDINNDGDIAGSDRTIMASAWLAEEGDDEYQYYADINGDGEVSNTDRPFIGQNWGKEAGDDDLVYPRALRAAEVVFAAYESGGIDVDLNIF